MLISAMGALVLGLTPLAQAKDPLVKAYLRMV